MNVLLLSRPYTQDLKEKSQEKEFHASIFKPGTPQNSLVSGGCPKAGMVARSGNWVFGQRETCEIGMVCRGGKAGSQGPQALGHPDGESSGVWSRSDTECLQSPLTLLDDRRKCLYCLEVSAFSERQHGSGAVREGSRAHQPRYSPALSHASRACTLRPILKLNLVIKACLGWLRASPELTVECLRYSKCPAHGSFAPTPANTF